MRNVDPAPIRARLDAADRQLGAGDRAAPAPRGAGASGCSADDEALTAFAAEHPGADLQALRTLIRNSRKEQKKASRRAPTASCSGLLKVD